MLARVFEKACSHGIGEQPDWGARTPFNIQQRVWTRQSPSQGGQGGKAKNAYSGTGDQKDDQKIEKSMHNRSPAAERAIRKTTRTEKTKTAPSSSVPNLVPSNQRPLQCHSASPCVATPRNPFEEMTVHVPRRLQQRDSFMQIRLLEEAYGTCVV